MCLGGCVFVCVHGVRVGMRDDGERRNANTTTIKINKIGNKKLEKTKKKS